MSDQTHAGDGSYHDRIAMNRGPVFGAMTVSVVEIGTIVTCSRTGVSLEVNETTAIRQNDTMFMTQRHWDLIVEQTRTL